MFIPKYPIQMEVSHASPTIDDQRNDVSECFVYSIYIYIGEPICHGTFPLIWL